MERVFFIVGPTATGKSEIAAEVAQLCDAEIVSADAFQIYRGLDLLTAKPDAAIIAKVPHHLIGALPLTERLNAQRFRDLAQASLREIAQRGKAAIVVGGSGLYVKALTHGLDPMPGANEALREKLRDSSAEELHAQLQKLDPETARTIDRCNRHRLVRAIEICLLTNEPISNRRRQKFQVATDSTKGVFLFREREELYDRIDRRVLEMFERDVVKEVADAGATSATAEKTLGLREIRQHLAGEISETECIAAIQQATRRYAKRQLTWFRRQTNFPALNLSQQNIAASIEQILREMRLSFAQTE